MLVTRVRSLRVRSTRAVAGQSRAVRRERGGPRRLSARNLPARFCRSVGRESARVLQARGDAGDGAQDEVDESGLLALRVLLQFFFGIQLKH